MAQTEVYTYNTVKGYTLRQLFEIMDDLEDHDPFTDANVDNSPVELDKLILWMADAEMRIAELRVRLWNDNKPVPDRYRITRGKNKGQRRWRRRSGKFTRNA